MSEAEPHPKKRHGNAGKFKPGGAWRICRAEGCANRFRASPSAVKRGQGRFCSRACAYRSRPPTAPPEQVEKQRKGMLALNRVGKANPNYKHGLRVGLNIRGWNPAAKGETCCRWCGSSSLLHLHHAIPRAICPPDAKRDLRNGITLCNSCHARWHRGSLVIPRSLFTGAEWVYISGLRLEGRDTTSWLDKHYPVGAVTREQQLRQMELFRGEAA